MQTIPGGAPLILRRTLQRAPEMRNVLASFLDCSCELRSTMNAKRLRDELKYSKLGSDRNVSVILE